MLLQIVTSAPSQETARALALDLIDSRLAACVKISGPIESHYFWDGKQEQSTEWLCTIKTLAAAYARVEARIQQLHPYDEPEILATAIAATEGYARWVKERVIVDSVT